MMQMYTYQLMVGFRLTLKELYKNSAILTIIKLPTNIGVAFVSTMLLYFMCTLAVSVPPAMLMFTFIITMLVFFSVVTLAQMFMTRRIIQKYLIDTAKENPGKKQNGEYDIEDKDEEFEEIFED